MNSALNVSRRERELAELDTRQPVDLLVIGGGVTGTGVALDAAARGLSVVLAERRDLAFGTSRWSSKLVHGGLRYLASGSVGIAWESAVERGILLRSTAPHLVRALPQVVPLLPGISRPSSALIRTGFAAGDLLRTAAGTGTHILPGSRTIGRAEVRGYVPGVRTDGLRGGLLGWDGQLCDDARLVIALARTAAAHGARVLTRCAVTAAGGEGAVLRDELSGQSHQLAARAVINATGVWANRLAPEIALRPSRGTHLVLPTSALPGLNAGLTVPVPGAANRFVFALPSPEGWVYVGLTDVDAPGEPPDEPLATEEEIDFLLETVNSALREPLTRKDIAGTYSGLRPLLDTGGSTADLSRRHAVHTGEDGMITVVGGKLTTYRRMAEHAVDAAVSAAGLDARPCRTTRLPLVGAGTPAGALHQRLVRRYGAEAGAVRAMAQGDPELLRPIADGVAVSAAELRFALRYEGAMDESDLLDRRTRIGLGTELRARALPAVREFLRSEA